MPKLPRVTAKVFALNAAENDIGQYGSALSGTKVYTGDIAEIQALPAYETGWRGAVISNRNYPTLQEMNGLQKIFSQQIAYLYQNGTFAEWDSNTEYYADTSFCQVNGTIYKSLTDNNKGNNPVTDTINWKKLDILTLEDMSTITSWSFPDSSKAVNLTLLASGQSYTQPVDGYYAISKTAGIQNAYVSMYSGGIGYACPSPNAAGSCVLSIKTLKNASCVINYNATGDVNYFRFIPAKGAVNE